MKITKKSILIILGFVFGISASVLVAAWQSTNWIRDGEIIEADKLKANLDQLEKIWVNSWEKYGPHGYTNNGYILADGYYGNKNNPDYGYSSNGLPPENSGFVASLDGKPLKDGKYLLSFSASGSPEELPYSSGYCANLDKMGGNGILYIKPIGEDYKLVWNKCIASSSKDPWEEMRVFYEGSIEAIQYRAKSGGCTDYGDYSWTCGEFTRLKDLTIEAVRPVKNQ